MNHVSMPSGGWSAGLLDGWDLMVIIWIKFLNILVLLLCLDGCLRLRMNHVVIFYNFSSSYARSI